VLLPQPLEPRPDDPPRLIVGIAPPPVAFVPPVTGVVAAVTSPVNPVNRLLMTLVVALFCERMIASVAKPMIAATIPDKPEPISLIVSSLIGLSCYRLDSRPKQTGKPLKRHA
jgi:hypothetical protein